MLSLPAKLVLVTAFFLKIRPLYDIHYQTEFICVILSSVWAHVIFFVHCSFQICSHIHAHTCSNVHSCNVVQRWGRTVGGISLGNHFSHSFLPICNLSFQARRPLKFSGAFFKKGYYWVPLILYHAEQRAAIPPFYAPLLLSSFSQGKTGEVRV